MENTNEIHQYQQRHLRRLRLCGVVIENFSQIALKVGIERGLFEKIARAKAKVRDTEHFQYSFHCLLPDDVAAVTTVTYKKSSGFIANVKFFAAGELSARPSNSSYEGYAAIAFLRFRFDVLGQSFIERQLSDAEIFVRDGCADNLFVAMIEAEAPKALAA